MANKNKIVYGDRVFEGNKIKSGNLHIATSLLSSSLEANTLSVVIETEDRTITEFERNAPIVYFYDDVQTGVFYVKSIDRNGPNTYKISATSAIGLLSENQHYGGIYSGETASELLASICGTIPYEIKTNLADIKLYGWLPIATARDNLSQVLFAIGATIRTDLNGVLRIAALWDGISGNLGLDRMYQGPSVTNAAKVTQVIVTEHQYIKSGESSTLFEGSVEEGKIVTFDDPVFDLSASGFTILESGANYAKLTSGSGKLTGTKYTHNKSQIIRNIVSAKEPNVKKVENATLVSLTNSAAVADRMKNYYKHAQSIQAPVVYKGESTGNRVLTWDPYNKEPVTACIEKEDITISNTLKSSSEMLVGYVPLKIEETELLENRVVLTGAGEWTVPEGTTYVRAVLIDGGQSGQPGEDGQPGNIAWSSNDSSNNTSSVPENTFVSTTASTSLRSQSEGKGGKKGLGGLGGRIFQSSLDVTGGQKIAYSCGKATGYGGESVTTFGSLSSVSGNRNNLGYTDTVTGETYALAGKDGIDGGDGGGPGEPGKDAGTAKGGEGISQRGYSDRKKSSGSNVNTLWFDSEANCEADCGGAGGGGAGGNGENGSPALVASKATVFYTGASSTYNGANAEGEAYQHGGGSGGKGKDGDNASSYGSGGSGGSGGGGAGVCGSVRFSVTNKLKWSNRAGGTSKTETLHVRCTAYIYVKKASVVTGGAGGNGGSSMDGCIILYYGVPQKIVSGPVKDKNGRVVLDKLGRRLIV